MDRAILAALICVIILGAAGATLAAQKPDTQSSVPSAISDLQNQINALVATVNGLQNQINGINANPPVNDGNCTVPAVTYSMFLQVEGMPGNSTDAGHEGWIEVLDFGNSIRGSDHSEFTILKALDKSSPKLYEAASMGKYVPQVVLETRSSEGAVMRFRFENVIFKEYDKASPKIYKEWDTSSPKLMDAPPSEGVTLNSMEEVSFTYGEVQWEYTDPSGTVTAGWDLTQNKAV